MSHHLDTPLAAQNGQLFIDDLYVFQGEASTVFDGADFEDLTYRVTFGVPDSAGQQVLQLHALTGPQAREDSADGDLALEGRTGEEASAAGTRIWAGRTADSFHIDLSLPAIINGAVAKGTAPERHGALCPGRPPWSGHGPRQLRHRASPVTPLSRLG